MGPSFYISTGSSVVVEFVFFFFILTLFLMSQGLFLLIHQDSTDVESFWVKYLTIGHVVIANKPKSPGFYSHSPMRL
ncbi:hypothetical protein Ct9H90mP12_2390 [bacterium]|nr:MAG: hypothetical protein Ct9H90mP12_2390 [bacterium]